MELLVAKKVDKVILKGISTQNQDLLISFHSDVGSLGLIIESINNNQISRTEEIDNYVQVTFYIIFKKKHLMIQFRIPNFPTTQIVYSKDKVSYSNILLKEYNVFTDENNIAISFKYEKEYVFLLLLVHRWDVI